MAFGYESSEVPNGLVLVQLLGTIGSSSLTKIPCLPTTFSTDDSIPDFPSDTIASIYVTGYWLVDGSSTLRIFY